MPTVFTHPVVAAGLLPWFGFRSNRPGILLTGAVLTVIPDLDVLSFSLGIPYAHILGHRGLSHSPFVAFIFSGIVALVLSRCVKADLKILWAYFFLCMLSHGILDAVTNGGYGIAFLAPFSDARSFLPFRPLEVSPLSVERFFSPRGGAVVISELVWVWLPWVVIWGAGKVLYQPSK